MLKAIVTVLDENDKIIQANRMIFESGCSNKNVFGTEHDFQFKVVTADDELIDQFLKGLDIKPPSPEELKITFNKEK